LNPKTDFHPHGIDAESHPSQHMVKENTVLLEEHEESVIACSGSFGEGER
jgi:hypothetical protein